MEKNGYASELSHASMERIIRRAGAQRVSASAVAELADAMEYYGLKLAREAVELARHAGRKTVQGRDIRLAVRRSDPP